MAVARGWGWLTVIQLPPRVRSPFHHKRLDLSSSALTHLLLRGVKQPHFEVLEESMNQAEQQICHFPALCLNFLRSCLLLALCL